MCLDTLSLQSVLYFIKVHSFVFNILVLGARLEYNQRETVKRKAQTNGEYKYIKIW